MPFGGGLLTLQKCAEETTTAATETVINVNTGRRHEHEHGQQAAAEDDHAVCIIVLVHFRESTAWIDIWQSTCSDGGSTRAYNCS